MSEAADPTKTEQAEADASRWAVNMLSDAIRALSQGDPVAAYKLTVMAQLAMGVSMSEGQRSEAGRQGRAVVTAFAPPAEGN